MATVTLFKTPAFQIRVHTPTVIPMNLLLAVILGTLEYFLLDATLIEAVLLGLTATLLHNFAEFVHQLGHAAAARSTGYPMIGMTFWTVLAKSVYPKDEPDLPAEVHIRRALGGPIMSGLTGILLGLIGWFLLPPGWPQVLTLFFAADSIVVFTLAAFLPLGFTDGSTLLYWLPRRGQQTA